MSNGQLPHIHVMPREYREHYQTLGWGILILLVAIAVFIAMGLPIGPLTLIIGAIALFFAYAYPYATYGLLVGLIPFLGITISFAVDTSLGEQAFGGSIDIFFGELVAFILLAVWAIKIFVHWIRKQDVNWKPWFPLIVPMLAIVAAHLFSMFSPMLPDKMLVVKYALRPVFLSYLVYVALTVNFVRSPRKLKMALGVVVATGIFAALMGFASFATPMDPGQTFPRARPLAMFGVMPLGDNHNLLAEWLSFTAMATLALIPLMRNARTRRLLGASVVLQVVIALLTFARTLWIVTAFQVVALSFFVWREELRRYASAALIAILLLIPLGILMTSVSSTAVVQSSTSSRLMLSEIALNAWQQSPLIGAGAGTFVTLVERSAIFFIEYGNPMDSHGFVQKILAETGVIGLAASAWFVLAAFRYVRTSLEEFQSSPKEHMVILILGIAALGSLLYQLFNTNYWNGKLWFPLGILLAATHALRTREDAPDILS